MFLWYESWAESYENAIKPDGNSDIPTENTYPCYSQGSVVLGGRDFVLLAISARQRDKRGRPNAA